MPFISHRCPSHHLSAFPRLVPPPSPCRRNCLGQGEVQQSLQCPPAPHTLSPWPGPPPSPRLPTCSPPVKPCPLSRPHPRIYGRTTPTVLSPAGPSPELQTRGPADPGGLFAGGSGASHTQLSPAAPDCPPHRLLPCRSSLLRLPCPSRGEGHTLGDTLNLLLLLASHKSASTVSSAFNVYQ